MRHACVREFPIRDLLPPDFPAFPLIGHHHARVLLFTTGTRISLTVECIA